MFRCLNNTKLNSLVNTRNVRLMGTTISKNNKTENGQYQQGVDYQFTGPASPDPNYEVWVGLETHAQVLSDTKLFSSATTSFLAAPNSCTALFDAAIPGTLPRINKKCIDQAIKMGLAVGGKINLESHFDRKHYFYCDMPQGYQITQQDVPIVEGGSISLDSLLPDGFSRIVGLERIQLEQDSGKSLHDVSPDASHVDLNRAGVALMEIVTKPHLRSADESVAYLRKLQALLRHVGASVANFEDGSLRCDVNVTVRRIDPPGQMTGRVEVKNMNSFKFIHRAINYEAKRQIEICENNGIVDRETRSFDPKTGMTSRLRAKEELLDYRFFPEPDLPSLILSIDNVNAVQKKLPLLPDELYRIFTTEYGLSKKDANVLLGELGAAEFFVNMMTPIEGESMTRTSQQCYNWLTSELFGRLKKNRQEGAGGVVGSSDDNRQIPILHDCNVDSLRLAELVEMVSFGHVSGKQAKEILDMMMDKTETRSPQEIAKANNMLIDNDPVRLSTLCDKIIEIYTDEVDGYVNLNKKSMSSFLAGQTIRLSRQEKNPDGSSKGEANPKLIGKIMTEKLDLLKSNKK